MTALSVKPPFPIFTDTAGQPLEDGFIYIGIANQDPVTNPITVYWDAALTIPASQPIRTLAGYPSRAGTPGVIYLDGDYSITVKNKNNALVYQSLSVTERVGSEFVTFIQSGSGAVQRSVESKLRESVSVLDFGADPTGATDSKIAIQAAIDACPEGGCVVVPTGTYTIDDELIIDKAITIRGDGPGKWIDSLGGSIVRQTNAAKNVFTLRASQAQYAFGQYGLNNVNFQDLAITGPSDSSLSVRGIGCDTTVNGGDYHIRECTFTNLEVRYFNTGIELVGICYLNDFYGGVISQCDTGFALYQGLASDRGGQTRFFGTTIDLITDACIRWNTDTTSGDLSLFGCTLADAQYGLIANEESSLMISGCSFENLKKPPSAFGAGIYIEINEANPSSDNNKTIVGNKFLLSDCDIWINCVNASTVGGQFNWPMLIDGNTLLSPEALRITMPVGSRPMSSSQFVLGASNAGLNGGLLQPSQISANFAGNFTFNRVFRRKYAVGVGSSVKLDQLPPGLVVTRARIYLSANATVFTQLFFGDSANNSRYAAFDASTQALNTWVDWTPTVPEFIASTALECDLLCGGTAGFQGFVGVAEIEGYIDYKL